MKRTFLPLLTILAAQPAAAASRTWDGGDATSNLSAPLNWTPNGTPVAGDGLFFPDGLAAPDRIVSNNYPANTEFGSISFNGAGYTFSGTILKLTGGMSANAAGLTSFNGSVTFPDWSVITASNGADFRFGAGSQVYGSAAGLSVGAASGSNLHFDGTFAVPGTVQFYGDGTVQLHGAKSLSGDVRVDLDLEMDHGQGLGNGVTGRIHVGNKLRLLSAAPQTVAKPVTMGSNAVDPPELHSTGAAHTLSGGLEIHDSVAAILSVNSGSLTLSGEVSSYPGPSGGGDLRKRGPGLLRLTGSTPNSFFGPCIVEAGTMELAKTNGTAVSGSLFSVGNSSGPAEDALAVLSHPHQIAPDAAVHILSDGRLDLNGQAETIASLTMESGGLLTTSDGALTLAGNVVISVPNDADDRARIIGNVTAGPGQHTWHVPLNPAVPAEHSALQADGNISGAAANSAILKTGPGLLRLAGNNTIPLIHATGGALELPGSSIQMDVIAAGDSLSVGGHLGHLTVSSGHFHIIPKDGLGPFGGAYPVSTTFAPGVTAHFRFRGVPPWSAESSDYMITDALSLNGATLSLEAVPTNPVTILPGHEIVLIAKHNLGPVQGEFAGLPEGSVIPTVFGTFLLSYNGGGNGQSVSITRYIAPTGVTRTWDGGSGVDSNWMTAANWSPNGVPSPGDALVFPSAAARKNNTNNFPDGTTFQSITVHGTGYSIGGNRITLNEKLEFTSASGAHVWNADLTLAQDVTFSMPGSGTALVQFSNEIDTLSHNLTLHVDGSGSGALYLHHITGDGDVKKTGTGTATFFEQPMDYTGRTWIHEGTLAVKGGATLGGVAYTEVAQGATLLLLNHEDPVMLNEVILLSGRITDNGGAFAADLNSQLASYNGIVECTGDRISINGLVAATGSTLRKTGPGRLTLGGAKPVQIGDLRIEEGELLAVKPPAYSAVFGTARISGTGRLRLGAPDQISDEATIILEGPNAVFDKGPWSDRIAALVFENGGTVTGIAPGNLITDTVTVAASAHTAALNAPLATPAGVTGRFTVADGTATPDLSVQSRVYGEVFEKYDAGRIDFTASQPVEAFDKLDLREGSALFFGNSQFTAIDLNGGTLGGHGTVGEIIAGTGGVIAPGASPGALGGYKASWNAGTTLRMELNGLSPGAEFDQYFANAFTDLGGARLELSTGFDPAPGDSFMIIRNVSGAPVSGTFAGIPQNGYASAPGARVFQVNYTGGDGDDVVLTRIATTPPEIVSYSITPGANPGDDSTVHFVFDGIPGLTYTLQTSTDLKNWIDLTKIPAAYPDGLMAQDLMEPAGAMRKFYRLILP